MPNVLLTVQDIADQAALRLRENEVMSKADTAGMKLKDGKVIGLDDVVSGLKGVHATNRVGES